MTVSLCLMTLLVLAQPVLATPTGTSGTYVEVVGPPVVAEGEEFEISVTVRNVTGLFGGQFQLSFDPAFLQGVDDSLQAGTDLEPSITGVSTVDNDAGSVLFAVSRQGDVDGLSGDLVLATMSFTATAQTEWTTVSISEVLLGDKDANPIASGDSVDLSLAITPAGASVVGQVTLEGRGMGSYDGSVVTITGTELSAVTDTDGNFEFADVTPGTYAFEADADGYLPAVCESLDVVAPSTTLAPVELVAGDVNDDGMIDIVDAVAIGAAFGDAESNPEADLNDDGAVNILDLILMAVNFGASSPTTWECVDP
jgi:hypothetical protein